MCDLKSQPTQYNYHIIFVSSPLSSRLSRSTTVVALSSMAHKINLHYCDSSPPLLSFLWAYWRCAPCIGCWTASNWTPNCTGTGCSGFHRGTCLLRLQVGKRLYLFPGTLSCFPRESPNGCFSGWGAVWQNKTARGQWTAQDPTEHINFLELWALHQAFWALPAITVGGCPPTGVQFRKKTRYTASQLRSGNS